MTKMKDKIAQYLDAYVAARRTERQMARQELAWDRWVARTRLAHTLGAEQLAEAARQRALIHGEAAARLQALYAEQAAAEQLLEQLARAEREAQS
jgi:phage shock protein A